MCPKLIFVPIQFKAYKAVRGTFREYAELVKPLSRDKAFLDGSHIRSATLVACKIKAQTLTKIGLMVWARISISKMLAKIAFDYRKSDGLLTPTGGLFRVYATLFRLRKPESIATLTAIGNGMTFAPLRLKTKR